jgi:hypothetical protein
LRWNAILGTRIERPGFKLKATGSFHEQRAGAASAVDVMRRAGTPMTAREIADALIADQAPQANPEAGHRHTGGYPCRIAEV